jgi:hypothetical protein
MAVTEYLGDDPVIYFDLSSTCTGWVVASMSRATKKATIHKAGVIWFKADWNHGEKYAYIYNFLLNVAYTTLGINAVVAEGYMVNHKRRCGTLVIPELTGTIKAACEQVDPSLDFRTIMPQSWRSAMGIKKNPTKAGSLAWKLPTREKIDAMFPDVLPLKVISNITGKPRPVPHDLYDAFGVCIGWLMSEPNNCKEFKFAENVFDGAA